MHYHAEVWVPTDENIEEQITTLMAPHRENDNGSEGFWDFYQIGGRWKGAHIPAYNPDDDPAHKELCRLCGGSGSRPDAAKFSTAWFERTHGCNGCLGTGISTTWPTMWPAHPKDVIPVSEATEDLTCDTLMLPSQVLHREVWNGEDCIETDFDGNVLAALRAAGIEGGFLATVDYHC